MTEFSNVRGPVVRRVIEWLSRNRLPAVDGHTRLDGLKSAVQVFRDRWGVPHIYAASEEDLFFAQGFVHAQDRFWQMEFQRRMVAGRLSEVLGSAAVPVDRWMRVLGLRRVVEAEAEQACSEERHMLEAYCQGVNAFLHAGRLPVEFLLLRFQPEPWTPADSLSWVKALSWYLSGNWECELLRAQLHEQLGPELAAQLELEDAEAWPIVLDIPDLLGLQRHLSQLARPYAGSGPGEGAGSNNWVVGSQRSTTGKPLFANDMHLALMAPAIWYENHLEGGRYHVAGVSLPGSPLVVSGHNRSIAWGYTAGYADNQDLYRERIRRMEDGRVEYEYRGEWLDADVRSEVIRVRGGDAVIQEVVATRHGPLINPLVPEETSDPLAMRWTALSPGGEVLCVLARMNRAGSLSEFRQASAGWAGPVLNALCADGQGNIGYNLIGRVPIRARGDGRLPVDGWTGENEWIGLIPSEELPYIENPPQGYIVTANNHVVGPGYKYFLGSDYVASDRAERITELLLSSPLVDLPYFQSMQLDQLSPSAQSMAQVIRRMRIDDPDLAPMLDIIARWDGTLSADGVAPLIYEVLNRQLLAVLLERKLGALLPRYTGKGPNKLFYDSTWGHHAQEWLRRVITRSDGRWFDFGAGDTPEEAMRLALRFTKAFLERELGAEMSAWSWGRMHQVTFQHILGLQQPLDAAFNRGPYPIGGDGSTIWSSYSVLHDPAGSVVTGPPFRFIADLGDLDHCLGLLAPGNSGHPASPHYDDQLQDWFHGRYHPMLFRRDEVEQGAVHRLELSP